MSPKSIPENKENHSSHSFLLSRYLNQMRRYTDSKCPYRSRQCRTFMNGSTTKWLTFFLGNAYYVCHFPSRNRGDHLSHRIEVRTRDFFRDISKTGLLNFKEEIIIYRVKIFLNFQYNSIRLIEIRGKLYDKYIYFWTNGKDGNNTEDSK